MTAGMPELPGGLPYLGHALAFNRDPIALLQDGMRRFGPLFRFRLFGKMVYALLSPKDVEAFFRAPDDQLSSRDAYRFTVPIFGKGVAYDATPEIMDQQLRFLHPGLRDEAMQRYSGYMRDEIASFCETLGDDGEIDLLETLNELTIFIAGRCLLGAAFRRRLSSAFAKLYKDLEGGINLIAFMAPGAPTRANLRRNKARRGVAKMIGDLIAERRRQPADETDFLGVLMQAHYADGSAPTDDEIAGLIITLLFAGQHTSAVMATWLGILLIENPAELAEVRREAADASNGGEISLGALKSMRRTDAVIKETERLHPPLIMLMRTVLRPFTVGDVDLPTGSLALISPGCTHRLESVFADPAAFDPGRFEAPRQEDRATPFSLIGFGGGKHRCIGFGFAQMQIKIIWATLLQRYDFELVDGPSRPNYATFVVGPRPPCRVRYRKRVAECAGRAA